MQKQKKTKIKSGSALLLTTILLFVILSMVVSLTYVTVMEQKMSSKTKSSVGAFFNADSGVEWALNKIANSSGANISNVFSGFAGNKYPCPSGFNCDVYFLDENGKVIIADAPLENIKAVRSVGTQGGETQRAIEAAVAATGGASFTYYCNFATVTLPTPPNICTNAGGTQGYCPSGFRQIYDLGSWGNCAIDFPYGYGFGAHFRPAGGGCSGGWSVGNLGGAYVCSQ